MLDMCVQEDSRLCIVGSHADTLRFSFGRLGFANENVGVTNTDVYVSN